MSQQQHPDRFISVSKDPDVETAARTGPASKEGRASTLCTKMRNHRGKVIVGIVGLFALITLAVAVPVGLTLHSSKKSSSPQNTTLAAEWPLPYSPPAYKRPDTNLRHLGCVQSSALSALPVSAGKSAIMTPFLCATLAKVAALPKGVVVRVVGIRGAQCYAGESEIAAKNGSLVAQGCSIKCTGDRSKLCGGKTELSLYRVTTTSTGLMEREYQGGSYGWSFGPTGFNDAGNVYSATLLTMHLSNQWPVPYKTLGLQGRDKLIYKLFDVPGLPEAKSEVHVLATTTDIFMYFQGSILTGDWVQNADAGGMEIPDTNITCVLHRGFVRTFNASRVDARKAVDEYLAALKLPIAPQTKGAKPPQSTDPALRPQLWLLGHSQGAAVAQIAAAYYAHHGYEVGGVFALGAPSPLKTASRECFKEVYRTLGLETKTLRIINGGDFVVVAPLGQEHLGYYMGMCSKGVFYGSGAFDCPDMTNNEGEHHLTNSYSLGVKRVLRGKGRRVDAIINAWGWSPKANDTAVCFNNQHCTSGCGDTSLADKCGPEYRCDTGSELAHLTKQWECYRKS